MKKLLLIVMLIILAGIAYAEDNEICSHIKEKDISEGSNVPKGVPFKNEVMNIYSDNKIVAHITIEDGVIASFDCTETTGATYIISIKDIDTVKSISSVGDFNKQLKAGNIVIEGTKFSKKFKLFFVKIGLKIASWFS